MEKIIDRYKHHTITECGIVTNLKTGTQKSIWQAKTGYLCVDIHENGKATKHYMHRLLAEAFIPHPDKKRTVNHIDGNKLNNALENLEWATDSENIAHAYSINLNHCTTRKVTEQMLEQALVRFLAGESFENIVKDIGVSAGTLSPHINDYVRRKGLLAEFEEEKTRQRKIQGLNSKRVRHRVHQIDITTGDIVNTFSSLREAMRHLEKSSTGPISNAISGRTKTAYGYKWVLD